MSRYSIGDIKKHSKQKLVEYIQRQPEIPFPTKICSRPVELMEKKHLLRALTGNYGYVKDPVLHSSVDAPSGLFGDSVYMENFTNPSEEISDESHNLTSLQDNWEEEVSDLTGRHAHYVDTSVVEARDIGNSVVQSIQPARFPDDKLVPVLAQQGDCEEHVLNALASSVETISLHIDAPLTPLLKSSVEEIEDCSASNVYFDLGELQGRSNDEMLVEEIGSVFSPPAPAIVAEDKCASALSPPPTPSPSSSPHGIIAYDEEISDEDLLAAYFRQNPTLAKQVLQLKTHWRKRRTDASLVRDFKFSLDVYKHLMDRKWSNDSGRILSKSIMRYLRLSPAWFTKAREVTDLLSKIGPDSANPDPVVVQRLLAGATVHKGPDILIFLKERNETAGKG